MLGNPYASGATVVISGNVWSGQGYYHPQGGIQFRWFSSGGNCYLGLSGGGPPLSGNFMTMNSGGMQLSGGFLSGALDGIPLEPGGSYFIPFSAFRPQLNVISGLYLNVFALCDQAASGVGRLSFEPF